MPSPLLSLAPPPLSPLCLACAALFTLMAGPSFAQASSAATAGAVSTLREVVVSGSRSERAIDDVPASIDVITGDDLDPARVQDIRDLVRDVPNMSVKRAPQRFGGVTGSTGRDGNAGFNLRGLEGNRVLLTVDGIRVPRELSSGVFGSAAFGRDYYDLGLISRVEIVRGASSALYGSDGLAGMVAMFTTEPKDLLQPGQTFGGRVGLRASSEDDSRGVGVTLVGRPSDSLQWLGSVQVGRSHELDNQGENFALNSTRTAPNPQKDKSVSALGKLVLTPGGGQRHTLTLEHVDKSGDVQGYTARATANGFQTLNVDGSTDMERSRLSWDGRFRIDAAWADELRATVGYQQAESQEVTQELRRSLTTTLQSGRSRDVTYTEKLWQGVLQAEKARALDADWAQKLVYGVDVSVARMDNLVTGTGAPGYESYPLKRFPPTRETNTALFVQSEFATERWSLIPALRYDRFDLKAGNNALYPLQPASLSDSALSPKLGAIFRAAPELSLFANLAAGFKAPSPLQLNNYFQNAFAFYRTIPNPNLKPERSRTFELGARDLVGPFQWEAAVFSGRYKDFIEDLVVVGGIQGDPTNPLTYQAINRGKVSLSGFELKGRLAVGKATDLRLAFGQTRGKDTTLGLPLNSVNPARLVLGVDHRIGDWKLGASLTHAAKKSGSDINRSDVANQFATPGYTTLDLRASWQVSRATRLSAAIHNLTDRKYWEWTNVRGVAANSPVLDAYTAPGRSLSLALVTDF
ncbi:TonB-dependent hemoglobin/transferrin/lactoferrin family receptor [Hydrogenophaga palleronii]|uniref:TonB-dependent hemoglobin/transferrin/lactoferrin family receptor n=1 Tax=Hydrogenophaga palleronii TaxID=65655 RepID=UPI0014716E3D|nr:TonB-dependent hemoglobin/transferrin/lactoferrin family receptor [Hydrogenophaga palleronii]